MEKYFPEAGPWSPEDVSLDPGLKESLQEFLDGGEKEMAQGLFEDEINDEIVHGFGLVKMDGFFERLEEHPLMYEEICKELEDVRTLLETTRVRALLDCLSDLFTSGLADGIKDGAKRLKEIDEAGKKREAEEEEEEVAPSVERGEAPGAPPMFDEAFLFEWSSW